jgi:Holliday junction resolvasome RuvABC DNA-binding subunit
LELKDKIAKTGVGSRSAATPSSSAALEEDLVSSLINLGYKDFVARETARKALQECAAGASLEQALKISLKALVR